MQHVEYYKKDQFLPGNGKTISELESTYTTLNSLHYRTKEFNDIDWAESVVIFGCSHVFGSSLTDSETICHQLENIIQRPVINMGAPSSSIIFSGFNQIALAEHCAKPFAVVNLWTSLQRLPYFFDKKPCHVGPWMDEFGNNTVHKRGLTTLFQTWNIDDSNPEVYSLFFQRMAELLWKDTKHIQGTFFPRTSEILNVELFSYTDRAVDGKHPGPNTAHAVALRIAEQLK
jgi:hypothetical protein